MVFGFPLPFLTPFAWCACGWFVKQAGRCLGSFPKQRKTHWQHYSNLLGISLWVCWRGLWCSFPWRFPLCSMPPKLLHSCFGGIHPPHPLLPPRPRPPPAPWPPSWQLLPHPHKQRLLHLLAPVPAPRLHGTEPPRHPPLPLQSFYLDDGKALGGGKVATACNQEGWHMGWPVVWSEVWWRL